MTPRTAHRPTQSKRQPRFRFEWWWPLATVMALAAVVIMSHLIATSPRTVSRVTLVNNSEYDLDIAVTGASHDGLMPIGTAKSHATTEFQRVIDQGPTWVFQFTTQGQNGGEIRVSHNDLVHGDWRVVIPDAVAARLRGAAGVPPSPSGP